MTCMLFVRSVYERGQIHSCSNEVTRTFSDILGTPHFSIDSPLHEKPKIYLQKKCRGPR